MNKKKVAIFVVAGTLAAMPYAAQAIDGEVYGEVHLSIDFSDNEADPAGGKDDSALSVNSNTSKLGFRGSEKLSDNLSVIWQYETEVELDEGDIAVKGRDTYGGLKGSWGTLKAGKLSTPMKNASSKIDIFSNARADHNLMVGNVNGTSTFDNRLANTIGYTTPAMGGVTLDLSYTTEKDDDALPDKDISPEESVTSLAIRYAKGPLYVVVATETKNDAKETAASSGVYEDVSGTKLVGRWDFGQGTKVGLVYEDLENAATGSAAGQARSAVYLNAAHKIGSTTLKAAYGQADDLDNAADTGATHYALSAYQSYSKNTQLYVIYTAMDNDMNAEYGLKDMSGEQGKTVSALSFGLKKKFSTK